MRHDGGTFAISVIRLEASAVEAEGESDLIPFFEPIGIWKTEFIRSPC